MDRNQRLLDMVKLEFVLIEKETREVRWVRTGKIKGLVSLQNRKRSWNDSDQREESITDK